MSPKRLRRPTLAPQRSPTRMRESWTISGARNVSGGGTAARSRSRTTRKRTCPTRSGVPDRAGTIAARPRPSRWSWSFRSRRAWFEARAAEESTSVHGDALFRRLVLADPADKLRSEAAELRQRFQDDLIACEDFQATISDLKAAHDESLQALLDDTQWEIVLIHRALSSRMRRHGRNHGGRFGPGGR